MLATKDILDTAPEAPQPELARRISDRILIEMECSYLFLRRRRAKVTRDFTQQEDRNFCCSRLRSFVRMTKSGFARPSTPFRCPFLLGLNADDAVVFQNGKTHLLRT